MAVVTAWTVGASAQEVSLGSRLMPAVTLDDQPGSIGFNEQGFEYAHDVKAFGRLPLEFSLATRRIGIDDRGIVSTVPLSSQLTAVQVGVEGTVPLGSLPHTYLRAKVMPSCNTDNWSYRASAVRVPVHIYGIYQPNDQWTWVAGIAIYRDYKERFFPIVGFIYKPNDRLTVSLVPDRPEISYALTKRLSVFGEGGASYEEYDVRKGDFRDVVLRYRETHLGGGVTVKLTSRISASVSSGYMFDRYLEYGDSRGKFNVKNGAYTEGRMEIAL